MSKLLVLFAVLLMPLGMTPAAAAAASSSPHHGPMASMPMQHCPEQAPKHTGKAGFVECTMACSAALPAADLSGHASPVIACSPVQPCLADRLHGLHPETATPPPKRS
jgi:hypothetical protein